MPTFQYEALNASGKPQKGSIEASSSEEAIQRIKLQGFYPTAVREQKVKKSATAAPEAAAAKKKKKGGGISIGGVSGKQLTLFTRQLSTLQDAGLPLLRSLQILENQQKPGKLKNVLVAVCDDVEGGMSLSEAMAKHPRVFSRLYTKMVAAGEIGGVLDVILQRLSEFMEKAQRLKRKVIGAMVYPVTVILVALLIVTGIMYFIIPQFQDIFLDFGIELPGLTLWLINTSAWVAGNATPDQSIPGAVWVMVAPFAIFFLIKLIKKTKPGRATLDTLLLLVPILGGIIRKTVIARFTRTLGTLISAGVPILEAITITRDTCGNWVYERALNKVHDSIREGESFAGPLRETKVCDPLVVNMIDVGEETGDMDSMLTKIADNYDEEVDVAVSSLVSLLEPVMVIVLGGIIGTIVVAMFLPMVKMIESLQGG
ncbi:MAG: type II secretion system F family protein [Planctomycetota bacterium]|nr:type II secretion system F family protein [Planctomycetota bacterium]